MSLTIVGQGTDVAVVATGGKIREVKRLRRIHGPGRWRKLKGIAQVRLTSGRIVRAEVHWYEAHGIGNREFKVKQILKD